MLHIKVNVKQIGKTTCTLEYNVTKNEVEKIVSNAIETLAFINCETRRPVRTPPEIIALSEN
ncbi:hypothetical protein JQC92_07895 [Shewanella sp. 202IG2-18]|nr:hypothetical protein [Parashewanella hymeniacidonis]